MADRSAAASSATPATATAATSATADADAEGFQFLTHRLAIMLLGAGHHEAGEHSGRGRLPLERFGIAIVQGEHERHRLTAILLRQQAGLETCRLDHFQSGVEVGRGGIKRLAGGAKRAALVVLDNRFDGRCVRHGQALRFLGRDVHADRAVGLLEIRARDAVDVVRLHGGDPVTLDEQQPPITQGRRGTQGVGHRLAVRLEHFNVAHVAGFGLGHFFLGEGRVSQRFEGFHQRLTGGVHALRRARGRGGKQARVVRVVRPGKGGRRQFRFNECLVKAAVGGLRDDAAQQAQGSPVGMRRRRNVVGNAHRTDRADPAQHHGAFTVLGRFLGVGGVQFAFGLLNRTEVLLN